MGEKNKRILVVDDEPDARAFVRTVLQESGYEVICAANGSEALEKVTAESPDLVVLDVMMPEMDGLTCCAKLRSMPEHKGLPVVLLTGVAEHIHETKFPMDGVMRSEAEEYLEKPVDPDELSETVARLLR